MLRAAALLSFLTFACVEPPPTPQNAEGTGTAEGLLCALETDWNGDGEADQLFRYTYDAAGRLVREEQGNGAGAVAVVLTYEYDAAGRLVARQADGGDGQPPDGHVDWIELRWYGSCE